MKQKCNVCLTCSPVAIPASIIKVLFVTLPDEGNMFSGYCRQMQDQLAKLSSELSGKVGGALIAKAVISHSLTGLEASYTDLPGT
jgi:hypothetical protein